tara:strand:- start:505 stop:1344 length:840 start_codon:yes stop_codon:yes gene_type:complete
MKEKVLFAGPWVGEFGWELFCWHGYIRSLSRFYDKTICVSTKHSKFLYDDFCDHFISFSPDSGEYKDSFYKVGFDVTKDLIHDLLMKSGLDPEQSRISILTPRRIGDPPRTHFAESFRFGAHDIVPMYKKYGMPKEKFKDFIILHARDRSLRSSDNWPVKNWNFLVDKLKEKGYINIVSIGLKNESMHIEGTTDMRECEHGVLLDLLASAKCIFGPSSGAIHLASLCGCPQIVWTTEYNFDRYTKNWNPFGAKVVFLSEYGLQPKPQYVYNRFVKETKE